MKYEEKIRKELQILSSIKASDEMKSRMSDLVFPNKSFSSLRKLGLYPVEVALAVLVFFFTAGGSVAYAAYKSNPGDLLYPIKQMFTEEKEVNKKLRETESNDAKEINMPAQVEETLPETVYQPTPTEIDPIDVTDETKVDEDIDEVVNPPDETLNDVEDLVVEVSGEVLGDTVDIEILPEDGLLDIDIKNKIKIGL